MDVPVLRESEPPGVCFGCAGAAPARSSAAETDFRSATHKFHPDSGCGEFDDGEVILGVFCGSCGDGAIVFDFAEDPLDGVAWLVEVGAEGRFSDPLWHRPDIGPDAAFGHLGAQGIGVIGAVGKQDIIFAEAVEHIGGAPPIVRLPGCDLQEDRQAIGIDQGVDLGRQPAF